MTTYSRISVVALLVATAAFAQKRQPQPAANTAPAQPIRLMTFTLNYHDSEKYAHLVRDESMPDILSEIIKPLAK
ncbi:MAG TPA: hypothetical protein VH724_04890 [Candidatus Angelobacter sp.]|jgi:hypothetical protein|nr:hypothetical protein [Candidatus Angelobacter sp.]